MKYKEFLELVEKEIGVKPSHAQISSILGGKPTANALGGRLFNDGDLKVSEYNTLMNYFNLSNECIENSNNSIKATSTLHEMIEIHYWNSCEESQEKIKNPLITSLWFDREMIFDVWKKDSKNLCIIAMPGDEMDGGEYPLKNGDILLIDQSLTDISISGVYFFTSQNCSSVFVNRIKERFDGTICLSFDNSKYEDRIVTMEQLNNADVKVIGRVIKNLSLTR